MKRSFLPISLTLFAVTVTSVFGTTHAYLWDLTNGMRDLGTLGGDSFATAINDSGTVIGTYVPNDGRLYYHGFIWTEATGMVDIGIPGGGDSETATCWPTAVNSAGNVVGYGRQVDGRQVAFFWSAASGFTVLGDYSGSNDAGNAAYAINDHNLVTGNLLRSRSEFDYHAFVWSPDMAHPRDIGTFEGQGASIGYGINNKGWIVGNSVKIDDIFSLTAWSRSTGWRALGMFPEAIFVDAVAINNAGAIIGYGQTTTESFSFYNGPKGPLTFLKSLGGDTVFAIAINHFGVIVGWSTYLSESTPRAVIWSTPNGEPRDIGSLTDPGSAAARGINNLGQVVGESSAR